ncbi:MAG: YceI family protein [Roseovarius sp.]|nr:YceI family protein [Roseovarius sp.]
MMYRIVFLLCLIAGLATAAPQTYRLNIAHSTVGFTYGFGETVNKGQMPVKSANMQIDLKNVSASNIDVNLDASGAKAGFFFATRAMKGPEVLDTARFPTIRFKSTRITGNLRKATVVGDLTVRGITRPVTLNAALYRQRGTDPDDLDNLTVLLTGAISRSAFGANGFSNYVGDRIGLRIIAQIEK